MTRRITMLGFFGLGIVIAGAAALACSGNDEEKPVATTAPGATAAASPGAAGGSNQLLGAVPNAPPRATATAAPPGFTPAPRPPEPEAQTVALFMYVDTVTAGKGESKFNVDATLLCAQTSTFQRGMHIVWRMKVVDTATGKVLKGSDVKEATLKVPGADPATFRYGGHGGTTIDYYFFTAAWDVPPNYPLGAIDFEIAVTTVDGKTGTFKQIPVSNPTSGVESRLQIIG